MTEKTYKALITEDHTDSGGRLIMIKVGPEVRDGQDVDYGPRLEPGVVAAYPVQVPVVAGPPDPLVGQPVPKEFWNLRHTAPGEAQKLLGGDLYYPKAVERPDGKKNWVIAKRGGAGAGMLGKDFSEYKYKYKLPFPDRATFDVRQMQQTIKVQGGRFRPMYKRGTKEPIPDGDNYWYSDIYYPILEAYCVTLKGDAQLPNEEIATQTDLPIGGDDDDIPF